MEQSGEIILNVAFKNNYDYKPLLIYIGGKLQKEILENGTYNISVPNGEHSIYARTGFIKSNKLNISIQNGEKAEIFISSQGKKWYKTLLAILVGLLCIVAGEIILPVPTELISGSVIGVIIAYIFVTLVMMNITLIKTT